MKGTYRRKEENVFVTVTSNMSSTLRGSTCTEFHRLTRCIRGVMVNTRSGVNKLFGVISLVNKGEMST